MNERLWLSTSSALAILEARIPFTLPSSGGTIQLPITYPERSLRLFVVAALRYYFPPADEPQKSVYLQTVEDFQDGKIDREDFAYIRASIPSGEDQEELGLIRRPFDLLRLAYADSDKIREAARSLTCSCPMELADLFRQMVGNVWRPLRFDGGGAWYVGPNLELYKFDADATALPTIAIQHVVADDEGDEELRVADNLQFVRIETLPSSWLQWNDGTVRKTAEGIYQANAFDDLPVLADALEEAGCTHTGILQEARRVKGCTGDCTRNATTGVYETKTPTVQGFRGTLAELETLTEDKLTKALFRVETCHTCKGRGTVPLRVPACRGNWLIDLLTGRI